MASELGGMTLAQTYQDILSSLVFSCAYVLNALCSQAIGSGNKRMAGTWLQISLLFCLGLAIPISLAFFATRFVLSHLVTADEQLLHFAGIFNNYAVLIFTPMIVYMAIRQFMQALGVVMPATIVSIAAVGVNIGFNQLFIYGAGSWDGFGFVGSPLATAASFFFQLSAFCLYAFVYKRYHEDYWPKEGWSFESITSKRIK